MPIVVLVRYEAQPGKEDVALREIINLVAMAKAESACLGISIFRGDGDDRRILLHERWTDQETYFGPHMQTPHIQAFIQRAGEFLAGPPDISVWQEVELLRPTN